MTTAPEWREYELGELFKLSNGINADKSAYGRGTPFINVLEVITHESLNVGNIPGQVTLPKKVLARYQVKQGDVLFNRTSETQDEVGLTSVYLDHYPVVFGGFVFRGRPTTSLLDVNYSKYALRAAEVRHQITARGQGGIRANIGQRDLKSVVVRIPGKPEQQAIAEAIDDASDLTRVLERLIAKKEAIKQGMMQQVFALPELECQRAALGSIASMLSGGTPDRSNDAYWSGDIPWISATTLKQLEVSLSDQRVTQAAVRAGSRMAPLNATLILVRGSALHSEVRASLVVAPVCFNQDIKAMLPLPVVEPKFLTYSIHANSSRLLRLVTSAGNTAGVLDTKVLKDFEIWFPDRDTQRRVIAAFDDVCGELDTLAARLSKARAIKTGMIQQFLSGRTRLPVEAAS
ncbi:MAG: restriction endonuclease subunit S [Actinomycetia bacterium]|nr:restriction endonuclease subunit S [Actinomycetes bacterium]